MRNSWEINFLLVVVLVVVLVVAVVQQCPNHIIDADPQLLEQTPDCEAQKFYNNLSISNWSANVIGNRSAKFTKSDEYPL
jgi:hypothetical protein